MAPPEGSDVLVHNPGDLADIVALEHCGFAALPPERSVQDGPWVLRAAGGLAKRANSANPCVPGAELDTHRLDRIEAFYHRAGLRSIVRVTPLATAGVDTMLAARGYRFVEDCRVMTLRLTPAATSAVLSAGIAATIDPTIPSAWHDAFAQFDQLDARGRATRRAMLSALQRPYAAIMLHDTNGSILGIGLAVRDGAYVGLFDVRVAAAARGRGLGRALTEVMLDWARTQDATGAPITAYLQVLADNAPARNLYRSLGFADAYAYHYRVASAQPFPGAAAALAG